MSIEKLVKRGEKSWNYFVIAFSVLLAVDLTVIQVTELKIFYKLILIILSTLALFYLCFFNNWFRNKIVGIFIKSQEKIEKY